MTTHSKKFRNVSAATAAGLAQLLFEGQVLTVRGKEIREIRNNIIVLERPEERVLFLPHRRNNIFTSIAETLWVIAGRNDIGWLTAYLKSAADFSDNGLTWRAGYGPRLRNWNGVDQIAKVRQLLLEESTSRRAAMSLYDPGSDFIESKDIPCNNWLHWLIRDGSLHLNVGVRSNDIVWGFSGINAFEWSLLHEMMAFWVGAKVGEQTYLASSFHVYSRHYDLARKASEAFRAIYCYDHAITPARFSTPWPDFRQAVTTWFELENECRKSPDRVPNINDYVGDQFLKSSLEMLRLYHGAACGWTLSRIRDELTKMQTTDLTVAGYEYFSRKHPEILVDIPSQPISEFFLRYENPDSYATSKTPLANLTSAIKKLHRRKDAAYGPAWKKRGEFTSILANIARKVDRLEQFNSNETELVDESSFDTAVDLFVYAAKYVLFLLEQQPGVQWQRLLPEGSSTPFSDHVANFDWQVDHMADAGSVFAPVKETIRRIMSEFEEMHTAAGAAGSSAAARLETALRFRDISFALAAAFYRLAPQKLVSVH